MKKIFTIALTVLTALVAQSADKNKNVTTVVYTGDLAAKVLGFNGPTPINIHIEKGVITKIETLENGESPQYFQRAKRVVLKQYEGKTVSEALKVKADVATGATYSSEALIENINLGLKSLSKSTK